MLQSPSAMLSMNEIKARRPAARRFIWLTGGAMQQQDMNIIDEPSFESLLESVGKTKDRRAFIALFDYYAPRLKSFFIKGGLKPDTADELAQETMLTVWDRAETYDPAKAGASTWIYTVARNKRIDFFRKTGRPEADINDPLMAPSEPDAPDAALSDSQDKAALETAMDALPAEQEDMIRKAFFEDKSHAVIAEETGLPLGTVKSRIRLALDRLRHALNGTLTGEE